MVIVFTPSECEKARSMYNFAGKYIYANNNGSKKYNEICDRMANHLIMTSIKVNLLVLFSYNISVIAPLYKIYFTDEKEMIIPVILPFIDPDSDIGFNINLLSQNITCVCALFIVPGTELVTCILKNTILAIAAIIDNTLTEFKVRLKTDKVFSTKNAPEFGNIVLKIIDYDR